MKISQKSFNSISTNLKAYTYYLIKFLKSHNIKKFTLEDSYQTTMNLFQHSNQPQLNLLKLISIISFIHFKPVRLILSTTFGIFFNSAF